MNNEKLETVRHSASHVLMQALTRLYGAIPGVGPAIENGFYHDIDAKYQITLEDLPKIENEMKKIIKENLPIEKRVMPIDEGIKLLKNKGYIYTAELAEDLKAQGESEISFYEQGDFINMCKGPHLGSTGELNPDAFKLTKLAGAYWKGDEKNKMLQRIYGVVFESKEELEGYLKMLEEAEKRDHRKLGAELDLFIFDDEVGPGLPLWLPKGAIIADELENLAKETEERYGYKRVRTPHIAKEKLYLHSGHLPYYADDMFPPMELDNEKYYLKAMNCPHHHKIYASRPKSYRDLPLRLAEYGHCYRHEDSGALFGLMRVRSLCMNDAHIYCTEEQFESEFQKVIEMYLYYFDLFGIKEYKMRLSKHSKDGLGKKYVNEPLLWEKTENQVRNALIKLQVPFDEAEDEAAFYGPKIDVQIKSAIGREFALATNQLDFAVPARFNLKYTDKDGVEKTPICIHRAPLGTHERTIGFLIEHFAGAFPLWLSPVQAKILPVSDKFIEYANSIADELKKKNIRVEVDSRSESLGKKIRESEMQKVPYMVVVGAKEQTAEKVRPRHRKEGDIGELEIGDFIKRLEKEIDSKSLV